jgi:hypothetical protein
MPVISFLAGGAKKMREQKQNKAGILLPQLGFHSFLKICL